MFYFLIENNKPFIIHIDLVQYWHLVALPHMIFDTIAHDPYCFTQTYVSTDKVHSSLGTLKNILQSHNIDLYIDSQEVKSANITISIDTTNQKTDWFELHPDVYYEGQKISSKEWKSIVTNNGIWKRNNEIFVVDAQTNTALDLLSRWMSSNNKQNSAIAIVPRLRIFDLIELRKNGVTLKISKKDEGLLHNLSNFTTIPHLAIPKNLHCTLRNYQKEGYYWLAFLYQHPFGACLADDMGLGKTVQALALLGAIHEKIIPSMAPGKPHLIVVPTSLVFNWINEIKTFYPSFTVKEYCSTKSSIDFVHTDIIITTYDIVRRDNEKLKKIAFNSIIFDEAQAIKNIIAKRTSAARLLNGAFKLCITGTPLENHVGEYYSIMDLALPGLLPHYAELKNKDYSEYGIVTQTRPFILRRTKEVIQTELPEKIESDTYFYMTEKQRNLYTRITQEIKKQISDAYQTKTKGQASIIALTALLRLRQICISPDLVVAPTKNASPSPKIEYLSEQLPCLIAEGHAALIFSQFTSCLDIIEGELQKAGIKYARIDGTTTLAKRKLIIESFQTTKEVDVLLMSLKTGGVGLNLTRASYVFHVDPWWNASVENQASDRAYRLGQKKTVMVIRLLMHHSIENKMLTLKKDKEKLFKTIVEGASEKSSNTISQADFEFLLN